MAGFTVRTVQTQGDGPGWISSHTATHEQDTGHAVIRGGEIFTGMNEPMPANVNEWALDVMTWTWAGACPGSRKRRGRALGGERWPPQGSASDA